MVKQDLTASGIDEVNAARGFEDESIQTLREIAEVKKILLERSVIKIIKKI